MMKDYAGKKTRALRGGALPKWAARAFLLAFVVALGAFGVARQAEVVGASDCGPGGALTVAPRVLRDDTEPSPIPTSKDVGGIEHYYIETPGHLIWVANQVNGGNKFLGKVISLSADIDLSAVDSWEPIGYGNNTFQGTFNGNNHIISNLTITTSFAGVAGFFGNVEANIDGLHLRGVSADVSVKYESTVGIYCVGMLAGVASGQISNCTVQGTLSAGPGPSESINSLAVGGLVGNLTYGSITDCHVIGGSVENKFNETEASYTGGVVCMLGSGSSVEGCSFLGTSVSGYRVVGGIVGDTADVTINGCVLGAGSTVSSLSNSGARVGGIVGNAQSAYNILPIKNCVSLGAVSGVGHAMGGILGKAEIIGSSTGVTIESCINEARVTNDFYNLSGADNLLGIGGIAGYIFQTGAGGTVAIERVMNSGVVEVTGAASANHANDTVVGLGGIAGVIGGSGTGTISVGMSGSANSGDVNFAPSGEVVLPNDSSYSISAGGLVGSLSYPSSNSFVADMSDLYNKGKVSLSNSLIFDSISALNYGYVGGIIGGARELDSFTLEYAYNQGDLEDRSTTRSPYSIVGGIAGYGPNTGTWSYLYSSAENVTSNASASAYVGGIIGYSDSSVNLPTTIFNNNTVSDATGNQGGGGAAKTTAADMKIKGTYTAAPPNFVEANWNFQTDDFPTLKYTEGATGFVLQEPYITTSTNGIVDIKTLLLPSDALRDTSITVSYTPSGADYSTYFDSYESYDGGLKLTPKDMPIRASVTITGSGITETRVVVISLDGALSPEISFDIVGVPTTTVTTVTSFDLSIDLIDGQLSSKPIWELLPTAETPQSVVSLDVSADNPLNAKLTIKSLPPSGTEGYKLFVSIDQVGLEKTFNVGAPEPTPVHVTSFDIAGVPTEAMLGGASSDLYIVWMDLDGVTHSGLTDPPPSADVTWSITAPASGDQEWSVTAAADADNSLKAHLSVESIGAPLSGVLDYSVTAHLTQKNDDGSNAFSGSETAGFIVGEPYDPAAKYVKSFSVKGNLPTETVTSDTDFDVYIEWIDINDETYSTDVQPNPEPGIEWSIVAPPGEVWDVTVTEDASNPLKAKVSVVVPDGDVGERSYSVQARMTQEDEFGEPRFNDTASAAFEVGRPLPSDAVIAKTFYVRKVPISPAGDGDTYDLYIEWEDEDGELYSSGEALYPRPYIEWSIIEPVDGEWDVSVVQDSSDPFRARMSIAADSASSGRQQYHVAVYFSQTGGIPGEMYTRGFYVGEPFPTSAVLSPAQQDELDRVNSILARTDVMISPGNHQSPIPRHILEMLSAYLRDLLEPDISTYAASRGAIAPPIFVLSDLELIDELRINVESPDIPSIPNCFVCTDKESANILLGLSPLYDSEPHLSDNHVVIVPMSYVVRIDSDDMRDFYGEGLARDIVADPDAHLDEIFEVIVLHKRIKEGVMQEWYTRLVNGVATPSQAKRFGMLKVTGDTTDGSLLIDLSYYVVDYHGESFVIESTLNEDGSGGDLGYIFLPDGLPNKRIIDPLWLNLWTRDSGPTGSGGGGCATGAAIPLLIAAILGLAYRRRTK